MKKSLFMLSLNVLVEKKEIKQAFFYINKIYNTIQICTLSKSDNGDLKYI